MTLHTDLNQRERRRHAENLTGVADEATKLAAALLAEDDDEALVHLALLMINVNGSLRELAEVFRGEVEVQNAKRHL